MRLEPGESTTISFSIGKEVFKPNDYWYSIGISYTTFNEQLEDIYSNGYFYYKDNTVGISNTIQQPLSNQDYFDLQGRRIDKDALRPGIYIHNNKKVVLF